MLDFTGGLFSVLQTIINVANNGTLISSKFSI